MKMVKSLLLGSAAGVVAVAGAQAADLPVKAKPVEYVKVCSLYGAGFYYIPGTDICTKFGGYVRYQVSWHAGDSPTFGPHAGSGGLHNRVDNSDFIQRSRAILTWDTRQQTPYGTLRTFLITGITQDAGNTGSPAHGMALYANRALIQIAGFTFGKATSYFDFFASAAVAYNAGFLHTTDTGDGGHMVAAYTHQFGNGVSATISVEEARRRNIRDIGVFDTIFRTPATANPNTTNLALGGANLLQDIVGNIRVQQAWGGAQISAAAHNDTISYIDPTDVRTNTLDPKWGWAVSGGLRLNFPMIAQGDYFQTQVVYSEGAIRYASNTPSARSALGWNGGSVGWGYFTDAVLVNDSSIELTTAWAVAASYEHFWTPSLQTSVYGNYLDVRYNSTATAYICDSEGGQIAGCSPNWSAWAVGSRSQWTPVRGLYMGLDVTYLFLNTSNKGFGTVTTTTAVGANKPNTYIVDDQHAWVATWRIHRDVAP